MKKTFSIILMLIFALLMLAATGCYTKRGAIARFCPTERVDTVRIDSVKTVTKTVRVDSIIREPAVTNTIHIPSPCDSTGKLRPGKYSAGSGKNKLQVQFSDSGITVNCDCDEKISRLTYERDSTATVNKSLLSASKVVEKKDGFNWLGLLVPGLVIGVLLLFLFKK